MHKTVCIIYYHFPLSIDYKLCTEELIPYNAVAEWFNLGIELGFTEGQLKTIEKDCKNKPVEECCRDMLMDWRNKQSGDSEVIARKLIEAVEKIEYNTYADDLKSK